METLRIILHWNLLATYVGCSTLIFKIPEPLNVDLTEYRKCLVSFRKSQPVWSWVIMHEEDAKQPFHEMLNVIYKVGAPLYNYDETATADTAYKWFQYHANISPMWAEAKVFILSRNKFYVNLLSDGSAFFRRGDKILFTNYDRAKRVHYDTIINYFGFKTSLEGLTSYNLLPIVSFLYVNESSQVDPVAYVPTNRSDFHKADKVRLTCKKLYSNSIDKLIFHDDYFTMAVFESVHAQKHGDDYFGRDAIIGKILVSCTRFPLVFSSPIDGATYGNERNYSGVYREVVKGMAQMALNARLFLTEIMVDNVVEYTYPYNRDDLVILIPVERSTTQLFYFSYYSYGISLAIMIFLYLYFKLAKKKKSIVEVMMIFLMVCSANPLEEIDAKYFRIIYMSMMVLSFYGCTLFNIQILSALALQPSKLTIKSVEEFAKTNYKIFASTTVKGVLTESLKQDSLASKILPRIQTPLRENETMLAEEKLLTHCSEYAVICSKSTARYYMDLSNVQSTEFCYNIVPEALMPSLVTYILGYRSPFQDKFNELLSRITENGLVANYTDHLVGKKITISDEVKPFGMGTPREKMIWIVYLIGISMAIVVFILEVISKIF